jgi:hypothetical protein
LRLCCSVARAVKPAAPAVVPAFPRPRANGPHARQAVLQSSRA